MDKVTNEQLNDWSPVPGPRWGQLVKAGFTEHYCEKCGCEIWRVKDDWDIVEFIPGRVARLDGRMYCRMCDEWEAWWSVESEREKNLARSHTSESYRNFYRLVVPTRIIFECIAYFAQLEIAKECHDEGNIWPWHGVRGAVPLLR